MASAAFSWGRRSNASDPLPVSTSGVTVDTLLERLRVPLSTWMRAAHAFSNEEPRQRARRGKGKLTLSQIQFETDLAYRTVFRMRNIIKQASE